MTPTELIRVTRKYHVLYVEDDEALRQSTLKLFKQFFGHIDTACDGQEGIEMFDEFGYDLVISDINMPRVNGIEFVAHIKETYPEQPVIITSAYNESSYLVDLIELGVDRFVQKPLDLQKLLEAFVYISAYIELQNSRKSAVDKVAILEYEIERLKAKLPFEEPHLSQDDMLKLEALEHRVMKVLFDYQMDNKSDQSFKNEIGTLLKQYHDVVKKDKTHLGVMTSVLDVSECLQKAESLEEHRCLTHLESFIHKLSSVRVSNFDKEEQAKLVELEKEIIQTLV